MTPSYRLRRITMGICAAASGAVLLTSCSSAPSAAPADPSAAASGFVGTQSEAADPVTGGVLRFGAFSLPGSFDPARTVPSGSTGGTELAAVYDLLVRYEAETGTYEPQLAQDLRVDDTGTAWTLTLRNGVTFSNGEPVDAAAVVGSIDRFVSNKGTDSQLWARTVQSTTATAPDTVVFELAEPWEQFPVMLATGAGMIVAPAGYAGPEFTPIGAGPFVLDRLAPGHEIVLTRRDDYWGGRPNLDEIRVTAPSGGQMQVDMFHAGELDMVYVYEEEVAKTFRDEDLPGYLQITNAGSAILVNNAEGRPGADVRVRQALQRAIDPALVDSRAQAGLGRPGTALFQPTSRWATDQPANRFDPDAARELLSQAKSDGYDGRITFVTRQTPEAQSRALALQALLDAVGFDTTIEYVTDITESIRRVNVNRDYDIAQTGFNIRDDVPLLKLYQVFHSASSSNASNYADPQMDRLLGQLQSARGDEETRNVIADIEQLTTETVPAIPLAAQDNMVVWAPDVHGVKHSFAEIMLLDDAWTAGATR
ncbi:ABC transporter substrate-binding protein [Prescottella sp. R16]|uniref:ABC transporter substrate-binding protein n=1 Tax=Prescottella sp. R16 TaxID=3064529 RepID=UPI00272ED767|nr:ABC transporter substrate-binding protein [Prescottella sp. R16]